MNPCLDRTAPKNLEDSNELAGMNGEVYALELCELKAVGFRVYCYPTLNGPREVPGTTASLLERHFLPPSTPSLSDWLPPCSLFWDEEENP